MPAASPPMPWLIPAMISHEEFQGEPAGMDWPAFHNGPTPFATARAQIIQATMPTPHQVHTIWNGILNFSGRSQRNGVDRNQKITKPTNWSVVVGMLGPKVFGIRAKEGHIAVKHTAMSRPPFQPVRISHDPASGVATLTLHGIPDEVEQYPLR